MAQGRQILKLQPRGMILALLAGVAAACEIAL